MKRKVIAICLLLLISSVSSCSNTEKQNNKENRPNTENNAASSKAQDNFPLEVQYGCDGFGFTRFDVDDKTKIETYDNKTKLVYLTNYDTMFSTTDEDPRIYDEIYIENKVNKYLDESGYDFYVDFVMNGEFDFKTQTIYPNYDLYEKMISDGEAVDIVNTGVGLEFFGGYDDTYHMFIESGYLEPLNEYFESDLGAKLYSQFDENVWAQTKENDGIIYGKTTDYTVAQPLVLDLGDGIKSRSNIDWSSIHCFSDLDNIIGNDAYLILDSTCELYYQISGFCSFKGVYINCDSGKAENIFENAEALKYLREVESYKKKGLIKNSYDTADDSNYISIVPAMPIDYDSSKVISKGYLQLDYLNGVVGISSSSKNKEKAFELLMLLNTDEKLADIIYNGIEGRNYSIDEGVKTPNKNALPFYYEYNTMTNPIIASCNSLDNSNKQRDVKICWQNSEISPFYGVKISDELSEKLKPIAEVYSNFYSLFYGDYGEYNSLDEALAAANEQLKTVNVYEVMEELNEVKKGD